MASNALTPSTSPKFALFRDVGVCVCERTSLSPQVLGSAAPLYTHHPSSASPLLVSRRSVHPLFCPTIECSTMHSKKKEAKGKEGEGTEPSSALLGQARLRDFSSPTFFS